VGGRVEVRVGGIVGGIVGGTVTARLLVAGVTPAGDIVVGTGICGSTVVGVARPEKLQANKEKSITRININLIFIAFPPVSDLHKMIDEKDNNSCHYCTSKGGFQSPSIRGIKSIAFLI
jgi:hypothetical protein